MTAISWPTDIISHENHKSVLFEILWKF